jgi:fluoride exporter
MTWVYVALGAALGAPLRYLAGQLLDRRLPWGTITVNVVGSFALGTCSGAGLAGHALAFLGTGFCGALTTFSALAVQTHDRGPRLGTLNIMLTAVPALLLCTVGFWLGAQA